MMMIMFMMMMMMMIHLCQQHYSRSPLLLCSRMLMMQGHDKDNDDNLDIGDDAKVSNFGW